MLFNIKKYGGFYIARYEVGGDQLLNDGETSGGDFYTRYGWIGRGNTSVTMAKYPYNAITRGSLEVENSNNAIGMARAFYPSDALLYDTYNFRKLEEYSDQTKLLPVYLLLQERFECIARS